MSLFEDDRYRWRETFFLMFEESHRPTAAAMRQVIEELSDSLVIRDVQGDEDGLFESMTILSPDDRAGMDIIFTAGEDVVEQREELLRDRQPLLIADQDSSKLARLGDFNARLEVFHFEEMEWDADDTDEMLDPGSLLAVLDRLAEFCEGVAFDPQSGTIL